MQRLDRHRARYLGARQLDFRLNGGAGPPQSILVFDHRLGDHALRGYVDVGQQSTDLGLDAAIIGQALHAHSGTRPDTLGHFAEHAQIHLQAVGVGYFE